MEKENIQMVRKQFVFILNYAVDILKKEYIESGDLVLFSSEVKRFRDWVKMQDIPNELKFCLIEVNYSYTNTNKELADVSFLFFKRTIFSSLYCSIFLSAISKAFSELSAPIT